MQGALRSLQSSSSTPKELYSTLFWPSSLSSKSFLSSQISVFFSLLLVQVGRFFHWRYLWSFGFPPIFLHQVLEVFHWLISVSGFPPQFPITKLGGFSLVTWSIETHQLLYRARMFFFSPVFLFNLSHRIGRFFNKFPLLNTRLPCSTELTSKKEGNCNVMVTRLTNYLILICDHSHDLLIWSWHVTFKLHSNIKSLLIPPSVSSLPCHDYIWVPHFSYNYYIFLSLQHALSIV